MRFLFQLVFKIIGWKITGSFPARVRKFVLAVAPHTSNWDFVIGIMGRSILKLKNTKFLGKDSLFKPPFGWLFRWLGGQPVDRSENHDVVQQVVGYFNAHDDFILALAPEGTRKKVDKLRTGFYYIAKGAKVPIIPVGFDFTKREVVIGTPMLPTENFDNDMEILMQFYKKIKGRNPDVGL